MGWFFRKSVSFGPKRLNFSKSGVGASFGMKGARVSVGPRGTYVSLGRGGIYYRQRIDHKNQVPQRPILVSSEVTSDSLNEIQTASIDNLIESSSDNLIAEINEKHQLPQYSLWAKIGLVVFFFILAIFTPLQIIYSFLVTLVLSPAIIPLGNLDRKRKTIILNYDLDELAESKYQQLTESLKDIKKCAGFWRINAEGQISDWKRNAGAGNLIKRSRSVIFESSPKYMTMNIDVCQLTYGEQTMCFLPDKILVYQKSKVGVMGYQDIMVETGTTQFIEDGPVPHDAKKVGDTWRFVNRNGGPDRRFSNNKKLPIMLYGVIKIMSSNGVNLVFHCSREDVSFKFKEAIGNAGQFILSINNKSQAIT